MSGGGGCGKCCGYAEEGVGTVAKFGEGMVEWAQGWSCCLPGAGCPVQELDVRGAGFPGTWAGCPGSGSGPNTMNSTGKKATPGQNLDELVDGKGWGGWGKLDPHAATQIHGPNPTKFHHTNKSQKKFGAIFGGDFRI